ncbi:hypothetical protein SGLAM104S_05972 [Streptomyces glaucescens]
MSVAPKASTPSWPTPPECGWTADDLDRLPNLPPHTELIDGSLVFVSPRTIFHERAVDFFKWQLQSLAPADLEVFREFTIDLDRQNRPEPDVVVVREEVVEDPGQTRFPADAVVLAIQVVSEDSVSRDRETKPLKYARAGTSPLLAGRVRAGACRGARLRAGAHHGHLHQHRDLPRAAEGRRSVPRGPGSHPDQGPAGQGPVGPAHDGCPALPDGRAGQPWSWGPRQRTNTPACPARSRKYCGATPSTSVTATPAVIAVMVSGDGTATVGPSGRGSLKNISTITRM